MSRPHPISDPHSAAAQSPEVIVVGAGLAGTAAAIVLARQGVPVMLVDVRAVSPPCFKAEKLEPDQADLLRKLDLLEPLLPLSGAIRRILLATDGAIHRAETREQYGLPYHEMVNALRAVVPPGVQVATERVTRIETSGDDQCVTFASGTRCHCRLVVLACGMGSSRLAAPLGVERVPVQREQSLAFGFAITPANGRPFSFDALNVYPTSIANRAGYLTLFTFTCGMRANLFTFWGLDDTRTRAFVRDPKGGLLDTLPALARTIGDFRVSGGVEVGRIDLYRTAGHLQPGLVLIGDAFMNVCPTTGLGLSKVLTDVDVLTRECVPRWLRSPGMSTAKTAEFYAHPRKRRTDALSLSRARSERHMGVSRGLLWRAARVRRSLWITRGSGLGIRRQVQG